MRHLCYLSFRKLRSNFRVLTVIKLKLIARAAVAIRIQPPDRMILIGDSPHVARIDDAVAHMHPGDLADYQSACFEIQFGV